MKKVAALAGLGASVFVARRYLAMRDAMADVDPELRSPLLPLLPGSANARTLPLVRRVFRLSLKHGEGVKVTERRVAGDPLIRVLVTTPAEQKAPRPAVLWIHSGGMILGSPQFEAPFSGRLARELGAVVVSPDYRLAPKTRSRPAWMTAWRRCDGCLPAPTTLESTPSGSPWPAGVPAVASPPLSRSAVTMSESRYALRF
jgi:acetyl esterase/lipase